MKRNIYPYQWELLACMITFKITNGLCLDYGHLCFKDFERINENFPNMSPLSIQKWFKQQRKVAANAMEDLYKFVSDIFPYKSWEDMQEKEVNIEILSLCQDWEIYIKLLRAEENTHGFRKLSKIKAWAQKRVLELNTLNSSLMKSVVSEKKPNYENINEYVGRYKYFMPGQIPPEQYNSIYVNNLEIFENAEVVLENTFISKKYIGCLKIKDSANFQILIYENEQKDGFEFAISIKINKYGSKAIYFPAIVLGFDGQGNICSYPILLTTDLTLKITSPLVKMYFETCYDDYKSKAEKGRMECISPTILQSLHTKAKKALETSEY